MNLSKTLPKNKNLSVKQTRKMQRLFAGKSMIPSEGMSEEYRKYKCNCSIEPKGDCNGD